MSKSNLSNNISKDSNMSSMSDNLNKSIPKNNNISSVSNNLNKSIPKNTKKRNSYSTQRYINYNGIKNQQSNDEFINKMNNNDKKHSSYDEHHKSNYAYDIRDLTNEIQQLKLKIQSIESSTRTNYDKLNSHTSILKHIEKSTNEILNANIEHNTRLKKIEDKFDKNNTNKKILSQKNTSHISSKENELDICNTIFDSSLNEPMATITFAPFMYLDDILPKNENDNDNENKNGKRTKIDKQQKKVQQDSPTSNSNKIPPFMMFNEILKKMLGSEEEDERVNNNFVELKLPNMNKDINMSVLMNELNNFVELDMKTLDDIVIQGCKFIEMYNKSLESKEVKNNDDIMQTHTQTKTITTKNPLNMDDNKVSGAQALIRLLLNREQKDKKIENKKDNATIDFDIDIKCDVDGLYTFLDKRYSINPKKIMNLVKPINILNSMIGMNHVKKNIYQFVSHFLQNERKTGMLNTAIYGNPGVGKTDLGKILCMIYSALEIVPSSRFTLIKATDLIGKYVGETRQKTKKIIDEADGGVLFIDEAYSLTSGSGEKYTYGKECIDTLNQELSENRHKLVVIIAGYEDDIKNHFFAVNKGLERRFPFRYVLNAYTKDEMKDIFIRMIRLEDNLYLHPDVKDSDIIALFTDIEYFDNCGGDIENLITKIEFANNKRSLGKHPNIRGVFTKNDLIKGLDLFKSHKKKKENTIWKDMYT